MKARTGLRRRPTPREAAERMAQDRRAADVQRLTRALTPEDAIARMADAFREAALLAADAKRQASALAAAELDGWRGTADRPRQIGVIDTNLRRTEAEAARRRAESAFDDAVAVIVGHQPPPTALQPPLLMTELVAAAWPFRHLLQILRATSHDDELLIEADNGRGASREIRISDLRRLDHATAGIADPERTRE